MLNKILAAFAAIKDRPTIIAALILCAGVTFYAYGCESKTTSLIDSRRTINREQLTMEIDQLIRLTENKVADLDKQDALKQFIFEQTIIVAQGGTVNPVGVLTSLMALMGIGFGADDIRVRKQRKKDLANYTALKDNENNV